MDLNKIVKACTEAGIFKESDSEADMLSAIASAANDIRWARERKAEHMARIKEACKPRESDITLGGEED